MIACARNRWLNSSMIADNLGQTVKVWRTVQQKVQNLFCGQGAVFLPRFRVILFCVQSNINNPVKTGEGLDLGG
jgi:hypothetical protein